MAVARSEPKSISSNRSSITSSRSSRAHIQSKTASRNLVIEMEHLDVKFEGQFWFTGLGCC